MATETVENYLKAIYTLCRESPTAEAGIARLGAMLDVTKGTATSMVKRLSGFGLVKAERYGGVTLTAKGTRAALDVLRRHRLVETFLVETLRFDWSEVHIEAERLEHALSPRLLERLDEFLGHPATDPHGDPIPDASGKVREPGGTPLADFVPGDTARVVRIADQDPAFLRFVAESGLKPGARVAVRAVHEQADAIRVEPIGGDSVTLSRAAARKVLASRLGPDRPGLCPGGVVSADDAGARNCLPPGGGKSVPGHRPA